MKLTKENILYIDEALLDAGIKYADIRYEMTDHVAAALEEQEGDFNYCFWEYMNEHQKELLASDRKFKRQARIKGIKKWLANVAQPWSLLLLAVVYVTILYVRTLYNHKDTIYYVNNGYMAVCFMALLPQLYRKVFNKEEYASASETLVCFTFIYWFINMFMYTADEYENLVFFGFSFFIVLAITNFVTVYQINTNYKLRYNG